MPQRSRIEDRNLAAENYPELNRAFYRAEPHVYLATRMTHLLLEMAKPEDLQALVDAGFEAGSLTVGARPKSPERDEPEATAEDQSQREQFVATESAALLQHASETLLRLYLAHSDKPPCPWLVLARERTFADFKSLVTERFGPDVEFTDKHRRDVGMVFFGSPTLPDDGLRADEWTEGTQNTERWLRHFASLLLGDAHLYNAFKHGLAVQGGEASLKVGDGEIIDVSGPSIQHLEVSGDPPIWQMTTRWIKPERMAAEVWMACRLIRNLWLVAKAHHLADAPKTIDLSLMPPYDQYRLSEKPAEGLPIVVRTMSRPLLYYDDSS